jgi:hypothetical protein
MNLDPFLDGQAEIEDPVFYWKKRILEPLQFMSSAPSTFIRFGPFFFQGFPTRPFRLFLMTA